MFLRRKKPPPGSPRFETVFVLGLAHCGSTLLGRMLDMHPDVFCVGEMMRLEPSVEKDGPCSCGERVSKCPFWGPRIAGLRERPGLSWQRMQVETFTDVARSAGKKIAFDTSKTLVWRRTRFWLDRGEGYVFLVRDSRGVIASALRKGKEVGAQLERHLSWMRRLSAYARRRGERALVLHYEDLCRDPESELRRVCAFMGIEFAPELLRPADAVHHLLHSSSSPYLRKSNEIRLDERWRTDLTPEQIAHVEDGMATLEVFRGRLVRAGAEERASSDGAGAPIPERDAQPKREARPTRDAR